MCRNCIGTIQFLDSTSEEEKSRDKSGEDNQSLRLPSLPFFISSHSTPLRSLVLSHLIFSCFVCSGALVNEEDLLKLVEVIKDFPKVTRTVTSCTSLTRYTTPPTVAIETPEC